jgi:hypothetical protein
MSDFIIQPNDKQELSTTSLIVFRLLAESKGDEMLNRLKVKLNKTKEEIHKIISEL